MQKLRTKLYELECERQDSSIKNLRKIQVCSFSNLFGFSLQIREIEDFRL